MIVVVYSLLLKNIVYYKIPADVNGLGLGMFGIPTIPLAKMVVPKGIYLYQNPCDLSNREPQQSPICKEKHFIWAQRTLV